MPSSILTGTEFEFRRFLARYEPLFDHKAQTPHFRAFLRGLIGPLERKSIEPIALDQGVNWRALQDFIGCSPWDSEALLVEHRRHVRQTLGSPQGIVIIDPTSFPKRGDKSVGVARQWCGQLGKKENCQVAVNLSYAAQRGHAFLDRRLYLPQEWASDRVRRREAGVPDDVVFRTSWELAYEMICRLRREDFPYEWITADEEFGKVPQLQQWLWQDNQKFIIEVPVSTRVWVTLPRRRRRALGGLPEQLRVRSPGRPRLVRVGRLADELPARAWRPYEIRDASKGPLRVRAALLRVRFQWKKLEERPEGWLLISETLDQQRKRKYYQSNAPSGAPTLELLRAGAARWPIEQDHEQGKNETGLGDYETRCWRGWHHHIALSFLAHHWLVLERNRLGGKIPRDDGGGSPARVLHRGAQRMWETGGLRATNGASAGSEPGRTALTLEAGAWKGSHDTTAPAGRRRSREVRDHSNVRIDTVGYP